MARAFKVGDRVRFGKGAPRAIRQMFGDDVGTLVEVTTLSAEVQYPGIRVWAYRSDLKHAGRPRG